VHILLIHQAFSGPEDPGGTRHYELGQRLFAMGHRLTVVTSGYNYLTGQERSPMGLAQGIDVCVAPALPDRHRSFLRRILAFVSFAVSSVFSGLCSSSVDLVIGTSPPIFQALSAWMVAAIRRRPFVLEIRDLWPEFAIELGVLNNRFLIFAARIVETFLYRRAGHIIVNSPAYREYLLARGIREMKISIVPNGVDASLFDPENDGEDFRREHGLSGEFVVMYAGALGLANDVDCLLRAASRLRSDSRILFAIVGTGKELPRLQAECKSGNLTNVRFIAPQPKHRMPGTLAAADVCVATLKNIPMFRTTYPNKVFDYMAAGRTMVLAIDGVIREVVEACAGGLCVAPGDDKALADAIVRLRKERDLHTQMGRNARAYVVKHFSRDRQAQQFVDVLIGACADTERVPARRPSRFRTSS
jgi:glycosyltransferase involved in cell wall biosynthesis